MKHQWCNHFILLPKGNGQFWLCLDPVQLSKALIRSIHKGPTLDDILPKLTEVKYLMPIDATSGNHNLKHDEKSYLTTISHPHGRYQHIRLPFGTALVGDMLQKMIDELFNDTPSFLALLMIF